MLKTCNAPTHPDVSIAYVVAGHFPSAVCPLCEEIAERKRVEHDAADLERQVQRLGDANNKLCDDNYELEAKVQRLTEANLEAVEGMRRIVASLPTSPIVHSPDGERCQPCADAGNVSAYSGGPVYHYHCSACGADCTCGMPSGPATTDTDGVTLCWPCKNGNSPRASVPAPEAVGAGAGR